MNHPRTPMAIVGLAACLLTGFVPMTWAQTTAPQAPAAATEAAALPQVEAEVRKIDATAGKITLKHGDIPNLDMPGMTMVFQVRDKAQLAALKVGDQVRFRADKVLGSYVAFDIVPGR